jgi:two-component system capsular synthesis response regulator RcsB
MEMKQEFARRQILVAETAPVIVHALRSLLSEGPLESTVDSVILRFDLIDRLQANSVDLLILDPVCVQRDVDIGNLDCLIELRRRFPCVPILFCTTLRDVIILDEIFCMNRIGICSKSDEMIDIFRLCEQLLSGNFGGVSPKIDAMFRGARQLV